MSAKTVYSYLRFSSPRQEWGDSERRQEALAQDYCDKHDLILSEKNFADRGISARKGANLRRELGELLNLVKPGDYLLIEDLDRLSRRDPLAAMNLLREIVFEKGVTVITLRDGAVITQKNFFSLPTFLPSILKSTLANEENEKKSMRIKEAWNSRRKTMAKGKFVGGKIPFWIKKEADGSLSIIENRAKVIRNIFDMAYRGMGFRSIMHKLAKDNVATFRSNAQWSKGGISYLLKNIAVYGTIQPYTYEDRKRTATGEPIENYYPAIITKEKFLAVQHKISKRTMYGGGNINHGVSNLFSGICKCSKCGGNILITHKGRTEISYLACSAYHWHRKCSKAIVNYLQVEKSVLDYISKDVSAIQYFSPDNSHQQLQQQIDEKKALLADINKKIAKLTDLIEGSEAPEPLVARQRERIIEQNRLKSELDALTAQQYMLSSKVSITSIVRKFQTHLQSAGINVTLGPKVVAKMDESKSPPTILPDRLMIREAFRTSVTSMSLDLARKMLIIKWNSNATSVIEMMFKRRGQHKAIYLYRAKTNGNALSDWISIGAILSNSSTNTG